MKNLRKKVDLGLTCNADIKCLCHCWTDHAKAGNYKSLYKALH
ncbi:hypothetical protein PV797_17655 [Clostridiaceae bacterium M8S5]|nr:hypothetical protein PV797_17655 [Clostridiaceae bacterium M8S5]